jgi:hypothetical protein
VPAIDRNERLLTTTAAMMDHGCNQFSTAARLSNEQHRQIRIGNSVDLFHHFDERVVYRRYRDSIVHIDPFKIMRGRTLV